MTMKKDTNEIHFSGKIAQKVIVGKEGKVLLVHELL